MKTKVIERGRAALAAGDAARLRKWLEEDQEDAKTEIGLSRMAIFKAASGGVVNPSTRAVVIAALARRGV
jgi:hypothetical protein